MKTSFESRSDESDGPSWLAVGNIATAWTVS